MRGDGMGCTGTRKPPQRHSRARSVNIYQQHKEISLENTATSDRQHVQAVRIKYAFDAKCRAMLKDGKSKDDVARYLVQIATDGGNGLDALIGKRYPFRTGVL